MSALVVNAKHLKPGWKNDFSKVDVRRSRGGHVGQRPHNPGYLGNPFPLSKFSLEESLALFRDYAEGKVKSDPDYRRTVSKLAGKTLVCACAPKGGITHQSQPWICHGQILAEIAERLASEVAA